jgi:Ca-activated chloride channel family protein
LDKLGPEDSLAVISFSDRAEVVLPAHQRGGVADTSDPAIAIARQNPHDRLRSIIASGGTEIYQGLKEGVAQARRMAAGRNSHVILLTDGHTYGDDADCLKLAEEVATEGIDMTALGIGADWNDQFLDALVAPSGGQSGFIEQPGDLLPLLESRLKGLAAAYGRNVTLSQNWPSQLQLRHGFKLSPFAQPMILEDEPIPLGNLEGRAPLTFILEFLVAPQTIPVRVRLPLEIHYRVSADSGQFLTLQRSIQLIIDRGETENEPPSALIDAVRQMNLYRVQEQVWEDVQSGRPDTAADRMRRLTTRYQETGDLRLARQAQLESQRLANMGTISPEGRKVLKYGTRSLGGLLDS